MDALFFIVGVIAAAAILARIIRERRRAEEMRERNYFKRNYN
jgi:4-hydroxybenzoate polyprenyltransferase